MMEGHDYSVSAMTENIVIAFMILWIVGITLSVVMVVSMYKIFVKLGKPGWYVLIPFMNLWVLFELTGIMPMLSLIPLINIGAAVVAVFRLAKKFNRSPLFGIGLVLFSYVFIPMLSTVKTKEEVELDNFKFVPKSKQKEEIKEENKEIPKTDAV